MRSSCHHSNPIYHSACRGRSRRALLLAVSLFLVAALGVQAADEPGDVAAAPEAGEAAAVAPASESRVFEVDGATITWNAPREGAAAITDGERLQLSRALVLALDADTQDLKAASREIELEALEGGMQKGQVPVELLLLRAVSGEEDGELEEQ